MIGPIKTESYVAKHGNIEVVFDGDQLCARFDDFINLQESPAGFGSSELGAIVDLASNLKTENDRLRDTCYGMSEP